MQGERHALWSDHVSLFKFQLCCAGYEFMKQGINSCGINTSMAVGSTLQIKFLVFDYAVPSNSASVVRSLAIVSPCDASQKLCPDGQCSSIDCSTR